LSLESVRAAHRQEPSAPAMSCRRAALHPATGQWARSDRNPVECCPVGGAEVEHRRTCCRDPDLAVRTGHVVVLDRHGAPARAPHDMATLSPAGRPHRRPDRRRRASRAADERPCMARPPARRSSRWPRAAGVARRSRRRVPRVDRPPTPSTRRPVRRAPSRRRTDVGERRPLGAGRGGPGRGASPPGRPRTDRPGDRCGGRALQGAAAPPPPRSSAHIVTHHGSAPPSPSTGLFG
jgi:hypothetical protein